jgi:IclR family acetate operon transcriptional repressor
VRTSLIERSDGGTYRPGASLRELPYVVKAPTLRERAPFVVEDLAASLHTTARLGVVEGVEVAYVEKKAGPEPGTLFPNPARLPLHATAMGKALLAFGPRSLSRVISGGDFPRYTPRTLACPTDLERTLQRTRTHGFALTDRELHAGASAVAVPVFDVQGRAVAAVEVDVTSTGPETVEFVIPALLTAARCLRRELTPTVHLRRAVEPQGRPIATPPAVRMRA